MDEYKYVIWLTNKLNPELKQQTVAKFKDLQLAKQFVNYQSAQSERYVITENNIIIYGVE